MWYELSYNRYVARSAKERLRYENDEKIISVMEKYHKKYDFSSSREKKQYKKSE